MSDPSSDWAPTKLRGLGHVARKRSPAQRGSAPIFKMDTAETGSSNQHDICNVRSHILSGLLRPAEHLFVQIPEQRIHTFNWCALPRHAAPEPELGKNMHLALHCKGLAFRELGPI